MLITWGKKKKLQVLANNFIAHKFWQSIEDKLRPNNII